MNHPQRALSWVSLPMLLSIQSALAQGTSDSVPNPGQPVIVQAARTGSGQGTPNPVAICEQKAQQAASSPQTKLGQLGQKDAQQEQTSKSARSSGPKRPLRNLSQGLKHARTETQLSSSKLKTFVQCLMAQSKANGGQPASVPQQPQASVQQAQPQ